MRHTASNFGWLGLIAAVVLSACPALARADDPRGVYLLASPLASPATESVDSGVLSDLAWEPVAGRQTPDRVVLLIHGLDELGGIWDDLSPALQAGGYTVARFEYPNDDPIAESAALLTGHLRDLRRRGTTRIDIVAHSMGGLVARDCLTRPGLYGGEPRGRDGLPAVERFITLGTPNHGSPLARFRGVLELRERVIRAYETDNWRALDPDDPRLRKGLAATDLLPGSDFLKDLNSRPLPRGLGWCIIAARITDGNGLGLEALAQNGLLAGAVGPERLDRWMESGRLLTADLGDGVVPLDSTPMPGVDDYVLVEANHRSMVKRIEISERVARLFGGEPPVPPAIPIVLERLARPAP